MTSFQDSFLKMREVFTAELCMLESKLRAFLKRLADALAENFSGIPRVADIVASVRGLVGTEQVYFEWGDINAFVRHVIERQLRCGRMSPWLYRLILDVF